MESKIFGWHKVKVTEFVFTNDKTRVDVGMVVLAGDHRGDIRKDYIFLRHTNPKAVSISERRLAGLFRAVNLNGAKDIKDACGVQVMARFDRAGVVSEYKQYRSKIQIALDEAKKLVVKSYWKTITNPIGLSLVTLTMIVAFFGFKILLLGNFGH
jgi:hypothetical protein